MNKFPRFIFLYLISLHFVISQEPNADDSDVKIVGGQQIPLSDAPFQVSLQFRGSHRCGGSIISTAFILTAAHCTHFKRAKDLTVRLGTDQIGFGGEVIQVKSVRNHPLFNSVTLNNDAAILILTTKITLKTGEKEIIPLPPMNDYIHDESEAFVSGWGETLNANNDFLRAVKVPIINQNKCKGAYPLLTNNMVCAGKMNGGIDSCQGDSGGPLKRISDGVLIGIVSFGNGCAMPDYPGVYTRVASVRNWIKKVAKF